MLLDKNFNTLTRRTKKIKNKYYKIINDKADKLSF